jgi:Bifunctional DNA primase/polymerase, N-terminal
MTSRNAATSGRANGAQPEAGNVSAWAAEDISGSTHPVHENQDVLSVAIAYGTRLRWHVFPCNPADRSPRTRHGFYDASDDPKIIAGWGDLWRGAEIGLRTGIESGIAVVDVDVREAHDGRVSLNALGIERPITPTARTPRGGYHWVFRHPGDKIACSTSKLAAGVDIKGDGGYIVAPPGPRRSWAIAPGTVDLAPLPQWARVERKYDASVAPPWPGDGLLSPYGRAALTSAVDRIVTAPNGSQESTLNQQSFCIGQCVAAGHIPRSTAEFELTAAAHRMPSYDPHRPWRSGELAKKIARALAQGATKPRGPRP